MCTDNIFSGIGNLMLKSMRSHPHPWSIHFYSSSGGNAGLACVTAAHALKRPATVVVPLTTTPLMMDKLRTAGAADVIQHGESWQEADDHLRSQLLRGDTDAVYVPPFDHPDIWEGVGTLVDELAPQLSHQAPDLIVCSVGGGGLFSGVMLPLQKHGWSHVNVLAVETKGADSLNASLAQGELVTLPKITSTATSLAARRVCRTAFEEARKLNVKSAVLEDAEAAMGCWRFADDERMVVEMACGVCIAMCYDGRLSKAYPELREESKVVIVVCGGSNVTAGILEDYRRVYAPLIS